MSGPVVLFGLDGATYTVLDDLIRRAVMPFLGEFVARGSRAVLRSTIPPLTPPAWTTMITGRSPGAHGIFNFLQYESPSSPYLRIISSREIGVETIWSIINRAGRRAGSLNFVGHSPAFAIDGYVIPGWVPWRWVKQHTHPAELIDRLKNDLPGFDVQELAMNFKEEEKAVAGAQIEDYDGWIDMHVRRERQWFNVLRHQLEHDPCALTAIVFDGVDKLQHLLWHYLDPALTPADPSDEYIRIRQRCWDYFAMIDGFLAETVDAVGPDGHVIVASDHGFTATVDVVYINTWLAEQGYLTWRPEAQVEPESSQVLGEAHPYHLTHLDLSNTRAYAMSASSNGIHIPVAGVRGEHGVPREAYEGFRRELADALLTQCVDPDTGEPLVTNVWTREEIFAGPRMDFAPDLTVTLRDEGFFAVLRSDTVLKRRPVPMGCHHPDGVFIAHGPAIRSGSRVDPIEMVDVAPTLLYLLNLPVPEDFEGDVAREAFTPECLAAQPVRRGAAAVEAPAEAAPAEAEAFDAESEAQVMMRLKALGYIE